MLAQLVNLVVYLIAAAQERAGTHACGSHLDLGDRRQRARLTLRYNSGYLLPAARRAFSFGWE